jgi:superfamily II DNA/RNA helicase
VVFVNSRNQTGAIALYVRKLLPESLQKNGKTIIWTYGAYLAQKARDVYVAALRAGITRILVCTDACGVGLNFKNIARVIQ